MTFVIFNFNFEIEFFLSFRDPDEFEHFGDVPIYVRGTTGSFSGEKVIKIMAMKHNANVLCKQQPQRLQINASFVIDLRFVTFEDLEADDNGSYINNGSPTHTFECDLTAEKLTKCKRRATKRIEGSNYYYLVRKYRKCASATDLTRTISYCLTLSGEILNQVAFVREEHKFKLLGHGNAKSKHVSL